MLLEPAKKSSEARTVALALSVVSAAPPSAARSALDRFCAVLAGSGSIANSLVVPAVTEVRAVSVIEVVVPSCSASLMVTLSPTTGLVGGEPSPTVREAGLPPVMFRVSPGPGGVSVVAALCTLARVPGAISVFSAACAAAGSATTGKESVSPEAGLARAVKSMVVWVPSGWLTTTRKRCPSVGAAAKVAVAVDAVAAV
ncbi:hypothetical protein MET9862_01803 [Methylobacterium symbioticum]|uniref:Uncharacterized protein n=1 Tax=Methylobacterium symbioticum TaxID=2584084 RepID=A0A509EAC7_9HYPH|nr:hypothetical protein MET9862_01803 [Methylobacterium symbioticum]